MALSYAHEKSEDLMPKPNPYRSLDHAPDLQPPTPMPWMDAALCAQVGDPALWFEESQHRYSQSPDGTRESLAKGVCSRCPVKAECLEFALATDERYGVWGGMTPDERVAYKRGRRSA